MATSLLTLALTLGALATVLQLANGLFWRALPVTGAERLVEVSATRRQGTEAGPISYPDYTSLRDRVTTVSKLAAHYSTAPLFVRSGEQAGELNGAVVSANFFPLLGLEPARGRFFRPEEDRVPGRDAVAVLSWDLWQSWFGGAEVLGRTLSINDKPFTVVGVAPRGFAGVTSSPSQLYLPTMSLATGYRWCADALAPDCTILRMIGRLAPGASAADAATEVAALVPERWRDAADGANTGLTARPYRGAQAGPEEARLLRLLGLFAALLIAVGTANLAGLALVRGLARSRELAIRLSLGAGRLRLLGLVLMESLLLGSAGGVLGSLLALGSTRLLEAWFYSADSAGHALRYDFRPEPWTLAASLGAGLLVGLAFGGVAGFEAVRGGVETSLRARVAAGRGSRARWLVGFQAALAVALVGLTGMVAASARTVVAAGGLEPERVALLRLRPRLLGATPAEAQAYLRRVEARLEGLPGVRSLTLVGTGVALQGLSGKVALPEWRDTDAQALESGYLEVGPRYFETLGTSLLAGREIEEADGPGSPPVAVVNRALAERLWPDGSLLGRTLLVGGRLHQVVGVVADAPLESRAQGPRPYVFVPFWQNPAQVDARLAVRVAGEAGKLLPALVRAAGEVDPRVPISETLTLEQQLAGRFRPVRMTATFLAYAAGLALLLAALGLYGTLAAAVGRRTREMAIRRAVGAPSSAILGLVLRDGLSLAALGVGCGLLLAVGGARLVRAFLYGSAGEGPFLALAASALGLVALAACWLPARRAAGVEPAVALRGE